jgi:integrase
MRFVASLVERPRAGEHSAWLLRFRIDGREQSITFAGPNAWTDGDHWRTTFAALGAKRAYALFLAELQADESTPTVAEAVEKHIAGLTGITAGTRSKYRSILRTSIGPYLGDHPVTILGGQSADEVRAWVNELETGGRHFTGEAKPRKRRSGKTIANHFALLSSAAETAMQDGLIERNAIKGMQLPDADPDGDEIQMLEPAEIDTVLRCLPPHWHPMALFAVGTGLRFGEQTALRKYDINLARGEVEIKRAWKYDDGPAVLGPPKTKKARRTVPLAPYLIAMLEEHLHGVDPSNWAFRSPRGFVVRSGTFWARYWGPARELMLADAVHPLQRAPRWHDLRHTAASWWLREGEPIHQVQYWLGHESIVTTVDRYGHVVGADRAGAALRMNGPLKRIGKDPVRAARDARAAQRQGEAVMPVRELTPAELLEPHVPTWQTSGRR